MIRNHKKRKLHGVFLVFRKLCSVLHQNYFLHRFYILHFFVGTIGHVAHGKSTVVKALSGVQVIFISLSFFCDYSKIIEVFCWCGYYLHVADFASNFLTM